jgi:hypothetical protein
MGACGCVTFSSNKARSTYLQQCLSKVQQCRLVGRTAAPAAGCKQAMKAYGCITLRQQRAVNIYAGVLMQAAAAQSCSCTAAPAAGPQAGDESIWVHAIPATQGGHHTCRSAYASCSSAVLLGAQPRLQRVASRQ